MPIHIEVAINDERLHKLTIGRTEEFKGRHHDHEYIVVVDNDFSRMARFTHNYADGALVCVEKALVALREGPAPI